VTPEIVLNAHTDGYGRLLGDDPAHVRRESDPAALHLVLARPDRTVLRARDAGHGLNWYDRGRWDTDHVIVVDGTRYGLAYCDDSSIWNDDMTCVNNIRRGGRHAFLYGLASVIDNSGGTAAEMAALAARGLVTTAAVGDVLQLLCVDGGGVVEQTLWTIRSVRGYARLELIGR
jgi:hypothetical protein